MKKSIVVIGSSNTDLVAVSPRIPVPGETILGTDFFMVQGGKGANQAVAAAKLGAEVFFVAKLGDDLYGERSLESLKKAGVKTEYVTKTQDAPSGSALITVDDDGNNSIVVVPGANYQLTTDDLSCAEEAIKTSGAVVCQLEVPMDAVEYASELAKQYNVPFLLDPAPAPSTPLSDKLLENTTVLKPNETEAELITGIKIEDKNSARKACKCILDRGVKTVILTMGAEGFLVVTEQYEEFVSGIQIEAVDNTAAGDAFAGGLACFLVQGKTILEAARLANYVAALSITKRGAQPSLPTLPAVEEFIETYQKI